MDKEKGIEKLKTKLDDFCSIDGECEIRCSKCLANFLISEGYGNVEQAVKEFAEKVIEELTSLIELPCTGKTEKQQYTGKVQREVLTDCISIVREKFEKLYGKENK